MRAMSTEGGGGATNRAAKSCQEIPEVGYPNNRGNILPHGDWFSLAAREIWKFQAAKDIQYFTGYSDRTCRAWTAGESEPSARLLALLLRTKDGPRILEYIMRDNPPTWYVRLREAARALAPFAQ